VAPRFPRASAIPGTLRRCARRAHITEPKTAACRAAAFANTSTGRSNTGPAEEAIDVDGLEFEAARRGHREGSASGTGIAGERERAQTGSLHVRVLIRPATIARFRSLVIHSLRWPLAVSRRLAPKHLAQQNTCEETSTMARAIVTCPRGGSPRPLGAPAADVPPARRTPGCSTAHGRPLGTPRHGKKLRTAETCT
jgi:hypothetical protein